LKRYYPKNNAQKHFLKPLNLYSYKVIQIGLKKLISLFKQRKDKEWGLVDCVSFIVMQNRGMTDALTADTHFQQAGFRPLLKNQINQGEYIV
jgi:hypothetical protein